MWVARDQTGELTLFWVKPVRINAADEYKQNGYWEDVEPEFNILGLDEKLFPDLKWEDEPKEVHLFDETLFKKVQELISEYDNNSKPSIDYIKEKLLK